MADTRAVIFDFFGTLTVAATSAAREAGHRQVAAELGVPDDAYIHAIKDSWPERARGQLGNTRHMLQEMARRCGGDPTAAQLDAAHDARRADQLTHMMFRASAVPTLRTLKERGHRIGLISDCTDEVPEAWPTFEVAKYVDAPVFSATEGVKKPDPEIYAAAVSKLGVPADHCLYVGDGDSRELPGAVAAGMQAVRLHAKDHAGAHVIDPIEWDGPQIPDLDAVLDLL